MTPIRTALVAAALAAAAGVTAAPVVTPVAASEPYVTPYAPEAPSRHAHLEHPVFVQPVVATPPKVAPHAMFRTPEAAMRYLTRAYNRHDVVALKHVTTSMARDSLELMRKEAVDLRLTTCTYRSINGDYLCEFTHAFPASMHRTDLGHAEFTVAPALKPGWYMTVLESCG